MPSFMKAARRDAEEEGGEGKRRKQRGGGAAAWVDDKKWWKQEGGNGELSKLVQAIGYLSLDTARDSREHSGILMQSFLVENNEKWAMDGLEEGKKFAELVKEQPGVNIGSPHIRVSLQSLGTMINSADADPDFQLKMKKWWAEFIVEKTPEEIAVEIEIWRVQQPKKSTKNWKKGGVGKKALASTSSASGAAAEEEGAEAEANYTKVQMRMKDQAIQQMISNEIMRRGGLMKTGGAPASPGEREVKRLLKKVVQK